MHITKTFKYQPAAFESKGLTVTVSHEDFGFEPPHDVKTARDLFAKLSMEAEALLVIEQVKLGRIHPNQIKATLSPWVSSSSPNTAQD